MTEKKIAKIKGVVCIGIKSFEPVKEKYRLFMELLDEIEASTAPSVKTKVLKNVIELIGVYGYEAVYNRATESEGAALHAELATRIFNLAVKTFAKNSKDLIPFYKEYLFQVFDEPKRSIIKAELDNIQNSD